MGGCVWVGRWEEGRGGDVCVCVCGFVCLSVCMCDLSAEDRKADGCV